MLLFDIGLTNTVTAVKNAQMAESPVLLLGGAAATLAKVLSTVNYCLDYTLVAEAIFKLRIDNYKSVATVVT